MKLRNAKIKKAYVIKSNASWGGWGNGYFNIPKNSTFYKEDDFELLSYILHGGVTFIKHFKNHVTVGFDTRHWGDDKKNWSHKILKKQVKKYRKQINKLIIHVCKNKKQ
jgi:hypothetical protein